jgi:hypothetical protein
MSSNHGSSSSTWTAASRIKAVWSADHLVGGGQGPEAKRPVRGWEDASGSFNLGSVAFQTTQIGLDLTIKFGALHLR